MSLDALRPPIGQFLPWSAGQYASPDHFATTSLVYDSEGRAHTLDLHFWKVSALVHEYHAVVSGDDIRSRAEGTHVEVGSGIVSFTADGALDSVSVTRGIVVDFAGAARRQRIVIEFSVRGERPGRARTSSSQAAAPDALVAESQDGVARSSTTCTAPKRPSSCETRPSRATSNMEFGMNVGNGFYAWSPWDPVQPWSSSTFSVSTTIYDREGQARVVELYFQLRSSTLAEYHALLSVAGDTAEVGSGQLMFTEEGLLDSVSGGPLLVDLGGESGVQSIALDFGPTAQDGAGDDVVTRLDPISSVNTLMQDGYGPGGLGCVEPTPLGAIAPCEQTPRATSQLHFSGNLDYGAPIVNDITYSVDTVLYDALGTELQVSIEFTRTAATEYRVRVMDSESGERSLGEGVLQFQENGALIGNPIIPIVARFDAASSEQRISLAFADWTDAEGQSRTGTWALAAPNALYELVNDGLPIVPYYFGLACE